MDYEGDPSLRAVKITGDTAEASYDGRQQSIHVTMSGELRPLQRDRAHHEDQGGSHEQRNDPEHTRVKDDVKFQHKSTSPLKKNASRRRKTSTERMNPATCLLQTPPLPFRLLPALLLKQKEKRLKRRRRRRRRGEDEERGD